MVFINLIINFIGLTERNVDGVDESQKSPTPSSGFSTIRSASLALTRFFSAIFWTNELGFVSRLVAQMLNDEVLRIGVEYRIVKMN